MSYNGTLNGMLLIKKKILLRLDMEFLKFSKAQRKMPTFRIQVTGEFSPANSSHHVCFCHLHQVLFLEYAMFFLTSGDL